MSQTIIDLGAPVPVIIDKNSLDALPHLVAGAGGGRPIVVADPSAWNAHGRRLRAALDSRLAYDVFPGPPGGFDRELADVAALITRAAEAGNTYSATIAFGGGATQNVAGVLCALDAGRPALIRVPTTLAAMVDVAPSVRQALDAAGRKNRVRIRYAPSAILCDVGFLDTAPRHTTADGFVEVVKTAMVAAPNILQRILDELDDWIAGGACDYERVIEDGVAAKLAAMEDDVEEVGPARCLRYGHEIGDMLERCVPELSHGEAVVLGMRVSGEIAWQLGVMNSAVKQWHDATTAILQPMLRHHVEPCRSIFEAVDDLEDTVGMVLLAEPGRPHGHPGPIVTAVSRPLVTQALRAVLESPPEC